MRSGSILLLVLAAASLSGMAAADSPPADQDMQRRWDMQRAVLLDKSVTEVESYLKAGFDPRSAIGCGDFDALDGAIEIGDSQMVSLLLRYGAQPKARSLPRAAFMASPQSALQSVTALLNAGADVNSRGGYSDALHAAVWRQNAGLVRLLLEQKSIVLNALDADGYSALALAQRKGDPQIIDLLLKAGADPALPITRHR